MPQRIVTTCETCQMLDKAIHEAYLAGDSDAEYAFEWDLATHLDEDHTEAEIIGG